MPSSVINHYSYDAEAKTLKITFVTGTIYVYENVPKQVVKMLSAAESKGRYFNYHIKDHYLFKKLKDA